MNLPIRALTWAGANPGWDILRNGTFESGNLAYWRDHGNGIRRFEIVTARANQSPGDLVLAGRHAATSTKQDVGGHALTQEIDVPADAEAAVLRWADRWDARGPFRDSPQQRYRVEVRAPDHTFLSLLFQTATDDPLVSGWTRRSADLSAFVGRRIVVAFVHATQESPVALSLDEIGIEVTKASQGTPTPSPEYIVRFSEGTPSTLPEVARVHAPRWIPPRLNAGRTYSWQVVELLGGREDPGPVWTFSTPPVEIHTGFSWKLESAVPGVGLPFPVRLESHGGAGQPTANGTSAPLLAAVLPGRHQPVAVVRYISIPNRLVACINVSTQSLSIDGWEAFLYDRDSWPEPKLRFSFPTNTLIRPGYSFDLWAKGVPPGSLPTFHLGAELRWDGVSSNGIVAVLLRNAVGGVVDFVAIGSADPGEIRNPVSVVPKHWTGPAVRPLLPSLAEFVRAGWTDRHTADDWVAMSDQASLPMNYTKRFAPGPLVVPTLPPIAGTLLSGRWSGTLAVPMAGEPVFLAAIDHAAQGSLSDPFTVPEIPDVHVDVPDLLTEGGSAALGRLRLDQPAPRDLVVALSAAPADLLSIPVSVTLRAGTMDVTFDITPRDDVRLNGSRAIVLSATAPGYDSGIGSIRLDDDETTTLGVVVPNVAREGGSPGAGRIILAEPAEGPVTVTLRAEPADQVEVPAIVVVPEGSREAPFEVRPRDNQVIDGERTVRVEAGVPNWLSATGYMTLQDDEDRNLHLELPIRMGVFEPDSLRSGRVRISGTVSESVAIRLTVEPQGFLGVPELVVIPAGAVEIPIQLNQVQFGEHRGAASVQVSASAEGFAKTSSRIEVRDDIIRSMSLAASELVVHPTNGMIYASVSSRDLSIPDTVAELDPITARLQRRVAVGPEPASLALSRDGRFLFVGMHGNGTVRRIRLDTMEAEEPFGLEGYQAHALVTLPGHPGAVAVNRIAHSGQDIAVYLDGIRQPGAFPVGDPRPSGLIAGPDDISFIFVPEKKRLRLGLNGISGEGGAPGEVASIGWRYAAGRLYAPNGRVLDADTFQALAPISDDSLRWVCPDPDLQRAYYLGNMNSRDGLVPGFGILETDLRLGVQGEPRFFSARPRTLTDLVRWGKAGLAFGADDTVYFIETSAVPSGAQADLKLSGPSTLEAFSGEATVWSLVVSNAGPGTATSIRILGSHDPNLSLLAIETSHGVGSSRASGFEWLPGHLAPGEVARASVLFRPDGLGIFPVSAVVRSQRMDSQSNDNRLDATIHARARLAPDSVDFLRVSARGAVFDPESRRLIVSVADPAGTQGGDRLLILNPANGEIESSHMTGPRPGRLAHTADGDAIWVAIDGKALLQRFDLKTRTFGVELPRFPAANGHDAVESEIWDIASLPGQPERVVATFRSGDSNIEAVLLDAVGPIGPSFPRLIAVETDPGGNRLHGQELFSQTFRMLESMPDGLRITDTRPGLFSGATFARLNDRFYTADGRILDATSLIELGRLNLAGAAATQVLPLPSVDRVVLFLPGIGLQVFQISSGRLLGTIELRLHVTERDALIHAGADMLILTSRDEGGRVVFIRTRMLPTEAPADLGVQVRPSDEFFASGSFAGLRIEVTNAGPHPAHGVRVAMPSIGYGGSVESSDGTFAYHDDTGLEGVVATLDPNRSIVLSLRIPIEHLGRFVVPVRTWSASEDGVTSNNFAATSFGVYAPPHVDAHCTLLFPTVSLVVHPDGSKLYATIPPDHPLADSGLGVFEIHPGSGRISAARSVGSQPGPISITADGSRLWVVTDHGRRLRRIRIEDWEVEHEMVLPDNGPITRIVSSLSGHDRLAIVRYAGVEVVQGDTIRLLPIERTPVGAVAFSGDGDRLLVARSRTESPQHTGWLQAFSVRDVDFGSVQGESPRDSHTTTLGFAALRLYLDDGEVRDSMTLQPLPSLPVTGAPMPFPELNRIVFVRREGGDRSRFLHFIDPDGHREVETQALCCIDGGTRLELVGPWGIDGLALRTEESVILFRSSLLPVREGFDFDGDELPDTWERTHGLNPHDPADAALDPDVDGASNLEEWLAGSAPLIPSSGLRVQIVPGLVPELRFPGVLGRRYLPEMAPSALGPWSAAGDALRGEGTDMALPLDGFTTSVPRFFRIRVFEP